MDEEKPERIYCGEIQGNKCVCKQDSSLPPAVTDYKALKRKWGTVVNKTLQHLPEANYVLESKKDGNIAILSECHSRKVQWTPQGICSRAPVTLFLQSTMKIKFWKTQLYASGNGYLALGSLQ